MQLYKIASARLTFPRKESIINKLSDRKSFKKGLDISYIVCYNNTVVTHPCAGVAQLVEQLICNQQVGGSSPSTSSTN